MRSLFFAATRAEFAVGLAGKNVRNAACSRSKNVLGFFLCDGADPPEVLEVLEEELLSRREAKCGSEQLRRRHKTGVHVS